jgi:aspartate kinase
MIIVQKYGGATLADPQKIKQVASRIAELSRSGVKIVAAVSAMGKTTNQLIELANQVSSHPSRRELDMLLTTGERISMALVSMALQDLGCQAISFTGSQAGILTDDSHINAKILDVKAFRVDEALAQGKVVVLAGFQGVSPTTKEITTLGRGGTDTTAVAMAAYLNAERCEILKDVPGVFTADPKLVSTAKPIREISYEQMMEMTFWGAKVLHYRCVELAKQKKISIYIGPAAKDLKQGTLIVEGKNMYESSKILGLNSHDQVLELKISDLPEATVANAYSYLRVEFEKFEIAFPQILLAETKSQSIHVFITGPAEILKAIQNKKSSLKKIHFENENLCSISATCTGVASNQIAEQVLGKLAEINVAPKNFIISSLSLNFFLEEPLRKAALTKLHELIT